MGVLSKLNTHFFDYFEQISSFPRGTGDEKAISDFLVSFAKENNLEVFQDENLNVIIRKPSTNGSDDTLIIQGHMDMVNEKDKATIHDFKKEGITPVIKGEYIYADGTTLGADNGIAVAYAMAILASGDILHPNLEVLITSGEEVGLNGASKLKSGLLKGNKLINLDSEEEGIFTVSCAGGARVFTKVPCSFENAMGLQLRLSVIGLSGGHSGMDIAKNKSNSIKVLARVLHELRKDYLDYSILSLEGGDKLNAIPREANAVISINPSDKNRLEILINKIEEEISKELSLEDKNFKLTIRQSEEMDLQMDIISTNNVVDLLYLYQNGVYRMNPEIEGMVLTSSNIGNIHMEGKNLLIESMVRSNNGALKEALIEEIKLLSNKLGYEFGLINSYSEWEYKSESKLREKCIEVYKDMYKEEPKISSIHAGLECGVLSQKIENPDMISLGPDLFDVHTPKEHISIESAKRVYDYLLNLISKF